LEAIYFQTDILSSFSRAKVDEMEKEESTNSKKTEGEMAAAKISEAEMLLEELRALKARTKEMEDCLTTAKVHYTTQNFTECISLGNKALRIGQLSKRNKKARNMISEVSASARKMRKEGYDLSETFEMLKAAEAALADSNFKALRTILSEAKKSMNLTKQMKRVQKLLESTKELVEELKEAGSITLESEILLGEASEALKHKDPRKARDLVKAVKKWVEIEALERERNELLVAQGKREVSERLRNLSPQIEEFQKLGIDTSGMKETIGEATQALDGGDFVKAKRCSLELEETIRSLKGSSIRAARQAIDRARVRIEDAREQNIGVLVAERSLGQAEKAYLRGEFRDSIDFAELTMSFVERSMRRNALKSGDTRRDEDYSKAIISIGRMVGEEPEEPEEAEETEEISPESQKIVDDSISELEITYMTLRAQEDLESMREAIDEADLDKEGIKEAEIMLQKAEDAFKVENYAAVTVLERTVRDLLLARSESDKSKAEA